MVCAAAAVVVSCGAFGADGDDDDDDAPAPAKADSGSASDRATPSDATSDDVASPNDAGPDAEEAGPTSCDKILVRNLTPEEGDTCTGHKTLLSVPASGEPKLPFVNVGTGVCGAVEAGRKDSFQVPHLAGQCITIEFVPSSDKAKLTLAKGLTGTFPSGGTYTGGARRVVASMPLATLTLDLEITSPDATTYTLAVF